MIQKCEGFRKIIIIAEIGTIIPSSVMPIIHTTNTLFAVFTIVRGNRRGFGLGNINIRAFIMFIRK